MTTIINRRGFILALSLLSCLGILNALSPVYGNVQEEDLKKQVETLTQKTAEQQKALDALRTDFEKLKTAIIERDKSTRLLISQHDQKFAKQDQRLDADAQTFGRLSERTRQHDDAFQRLNQTLTQYRDRILNIENRLRAKGL